MNTTSNRPSQSKTKHTKPSKLIKPDLSNHTYYTKHIKPKILKQIGMSQKGNVRFSTGCLKKPQHKVSCSISVIKPG